jgi:hypothetical protein
MSNLMKAVQWEQSSIWTDRQKDRHRAKLTVTFRNFAKKPKASNDSIRYSRLTCFIYQFNAQFIYSRIIYYIIILDMFRAIPCPSSGCQIVLLQNLVSSLSVSKYSVHRLGADCSEYLLTESDDTRCCNNTI